MTQTTVLELPSETMTLNFGPQHPATHGTLRVVMELDGETITRVTPEIGYLHTGFEKLAEYQDYNQFITVTDRMNYLSPINNNIAFALSVEKLLGVELPIRGQYERVIMAEVSRIADHLLSIGMQALDLGAFTVFLYFFQEREKCYDLFEQITGTRLTTTYTRIGGVMRPIPEEGFTKIREFMDYLPTVMDEVVTLLNRNQIWIGRTRGVGAVSAEDAVNYGLTGPILRATGKAWDIRKAEPYLCYDRFDFDVPTGTTGDVLDRYLVRMEEIRQSLRILEQALATIPDGPVNIDDPKFVLPPKEDVHNTMEGLIHHFMVTMENRGFDVPCGESYVPTEAPNGELGFFIVSSGGREPYRVRVRPPSLMNYQIFAPTITGCMISDAVAILGSLNIIAGELDR